MGAQGNGWSSLSTPTADRPLTVGDSEPDLEKQSYRRKLQSFYDVKEEIGRYLPLTSHPGTPASWTFYNVEPPGTLTREPPTPHSGAPVTLESPPPGNPASLEPPSQCPLAAREPCPASQPPSPCFPEPSSLWNIARPATPPMESSGLLDGPNPSTCPPKSPPLQVPSYLQESPPTHPQPLPTHPQPLPTQNPTLQEPFYPHTQPLPLPSPHSRCLPGTAPCQESSPIPPGPLSPFTPPQSPFSGVQRGLPSSQGRVQLREESAA